jgi:hypothetical protein
LNKTTVKVNGALVDTFGHDERTLHEIALCYGERGDRVTVARTFFTYSITRGVHDVLPSSARTGARGDARAAS